MEIESPVLEKIKSRGYWRILISPISHKVRFKQTTDCFQFIEKNFVDIDGLTFPFYTGLSVAKDESLIKEYFSEYALCSADYGSIKEYWRLYRSGQFIHFTGILDDWWQDDVFQRSYLTSIKPFERISYNQSIMLTVTQVFDFMNRMCSYDIYNEGLSINMQIHKLHNRSLWFPDNRMFLQLKPSKENIFTEEKTFSKEDLIIRHRDLSIDVLLRIYELFNWHPSADQLKTYQEKMVKTGRFDQT